MKNFLKNKKLLLWLGVGVAVLAVAVTTVLLLVGGFGAKNSNDRYELYWNVDGESHTMNSETGLSDREPDEKGVYRMRFASQNGIEEFTTTDKKLVNLLDTMFVVALDTDGNEIVDVQDPAFLGYTVYKGLYVRSVSTGTITCNTSVILNGMPVRVRISDELQVLDVRADAEKIGGQIQPEALNALDYIYTCAKEDQVFTHLFLAGRSAKSSIYWRASQQYSSTTKETTRVPDENGVYTVDFFSDGKYVELKCKDKSVVTTIDRANRFICHFALEFDEDGYITKTKMSSLGIKGAVGCSNYVVTDYIDGEFTATVLSGNELGAEYSNVLDGDCKIYDVSKTAMAEGRQGQQVDSLQLGDRIVLWTDPDGFPVEAYITLRMVEETPWFNMERRWSSYYKQTLRKPDSEGYYSVELLKAGESKPQVFKTQDKALVDLIDSRGDRTVGIRAEGDILKTVYEAECIFGYTNQGPRYVTNASGTLYSAMAYKTPSDTINGVYNTDCPIYDVSGTGPMGAQTELRAGDLIIIHRNAKLETVQIYVTKRAMGVENAYYNLERKYDSDKKVTTREPVDGYYVFKMANKGKIVTVKTSDKELATKMDSFAPPAMGLVVKNGIVQYVYDPVQISGAVRVAYYSTVTSIDKDGTISARTSTGIESTFMPAKDCTFYNGSHMFKTNRGEKVSGVKVGDTITGYLDMYGEAKVVFIISRDLEDIAWNVQRKYDSTTKETTREPVDGWYIFTLLVGDKVKEVRTQDRELANRVDSYEAAFGIVLDKDIIINVTGVGLVKDVDTSGVNGWDVVKVNGNKVTLCYTKPGSEKYTGQEMEVVLSKKLKAFDISPTAEVYGQQVNLQLGDRIRTYLDEKGQVIYAYVLNHATRASGTESYCSHCNQIVHWEPWTGGTIVKADRHYYMNCDVEKTVVLSNTETSTKTTKTEQKTEVVPFDTVLDLNGKTMTVNGSRCFTVNDGQTMTIMDSVGGGVLTSGGPVNGGVFSVQKGGTLNLQAGTFKGAVENANKGSVIYIVAGGTVNVSGTAVVDASAVTLGKGTVGAVYTSGTLNVLGGEIKGGSAGSGGSVYVNAGTLNIAGGKISGGQATNYGDDIFVNNPEVVVSISGGEVAGQFQINDAKSIAVSGAPKLARLMLAAFMKMDLGVMTDGADIGIYTSEKGAITNANKNAGSYAKYFHAVSNIQQILAIEDEIHITTANARYQLCDHCNQKVLWQPYVGEVLKQNMHYYVAEDLLWEAPPVKEPEETTPETTTESTTESSVPETTEPGEEEKPEPPAPYETVLDLNGKKIVKKNGTRCFLVGENQTMTVMDTVGGGLMHSGAVERENKAAEPAKINGGVFNVQNNGVLNLTGGKFEGVVEEKGKGSVIYVIAGGTVNVSGTAIVDGSGVKLAAGTGSAIYNSGTVNVSGGEIKGGSVESGGSIYMAAGNLNISGGKISGGQAANYGDDIFVNNADSVITISGGEVAGQFQISKAKSVTLSGAPKLGNLKLGSSVKLSLGQMQEGADIVAAVSGAFTKSSENAENYKTYFRYTNNTRTVFVLNNVLYMKDTASYIDQCSHCNENVIWEPWKATATESGHYFLSNRVERTVVYAPEGADMVIDLHGEVWETTNNNRGMQIDAGVTVTIMDTVGTGVIKASGVSDGGIFTVNGGTLNFVSGTAQSLKAINSQKGSVVYVANGGVLNLSGGILDASAIQNGGGSCGAVYSVGTVNIRGGEIKGASVGSGGSITIAEGNLAISGGKISGGQAANYGDDIFVNNADSVVTISGGEVAGQIQINKAKSVTLSGAPQLANVKLTTSVKFTLGELSNDARIAVAAAGEFAVANEKAKDYLDAGCFTTVSNKESIKVTADGVLYIPTCPHCDQPMGSITWKAWDGVAGDRNTTGHYRLTATYEQDGQVKLTGGDVVLDLAGNTLSTESGRPFYVGGGTLTILDTSAEKTGTVIGNQTSTGGAVYVHKNGTMHIYGGTFKNNAASCSNGGVMNVVGRLTLHDGVIEGKKSNAGGAVYCNGLFTMEGGTITGGESTGAGGTVYVAGGTFALNDGTIEAGTATTSGGTIFATAGTLNLNGGVVESGTVGSDKSGTAVFAYLASGSTSCAVNIGSVQILSTERNSVVIGTGVTLGISGAPKIGYMSVNVATSLTVGTMEEGASVYLAIETRIPLTTVNAQMQTYLDKGYFRAYATDKKLILDGNALKYADLQ